MPARLVLLTGASCSGKTTLARLVQQTSPQTRVHLFDSIGVPSPDIMAAFGPGHQPGGAWQRAMTLQWIGRIAPELAAGHSVLLEGQTRPAFFEEALAIANLPFSRGVLVDCDDPTRIARLHQDRTFSQPEISQMLDWARYLRTEAAHFGYDVLDTTATPLSGCVDFLLRALAS